MGIRWRITFFQNWILHNFWIAALLGRRLYSPSLKDITQLIFLSFHTFVWKFGWFVEKKNYKYLAFKFDLTGSSHLKWSKHWINFSSNCTEHVTFATWIRAGKLVNPPCETPPPPPLPLISAEKSMWGQLPLLPSTNSLVLLLFYRVPKWWRHKNDFLEIMGFTEIFWKYMMKNAYLPKITILLQFGDEIVAL